LDFFIANFQLKETFALIYATYKKYLDRRGSYICLCLKLKRMTMKPLKLFLLFFIMSALGLNAQKHVPAEGNVLLIIGQDLESIYNYTQDPNMPVPGGVTAYIDLYNCDKPQDNISCFFPFGGLGEDNDGNKVIDIDWGSGPLNASNAADGNPNSVLVIGLYMSEEWTPNGLARIAGGEFDNAVMKLGNFIASKDRPVYLRIGYEFDGKWNTGYSNTTNFKNAYRRIVDIIRPIASKCEMVLQASTSPVDDILEQYRENIADWYPGDEYVDWMGLSWFLPPTFTQGLMSGNYVVPNQKELADEVLALARAHSKPVMICESAPQGYNLTNLNFKNINTMLPNYGSPATGQVNKTADELWNEWFKPYFDYIHTNKDVIRAVAYINCNWDVQAKWAPPYNEGYWGDTRVQTHPGIKAKWLDEMSKDSWLHGSEDLFGLLGDFDHNNNDDGDGDDENDPDIPPITNVAVPEDGKTYLIIGQTFKQEYIDYINAMGKAPAGSSHYGEIYNGKINQGDDYNDNAFLDWMYRNYPDAVVEIALAIKDNPAAGGYDPRQNPLWLHQACKDIADGVWDNAVNNVITTLKKYPKMQFLVRIGYEVSLEPFAKCVDIDINEKYNSLGKNWLEMAERGEVPEIDADAYKNAFRRVANMLKKECPNVATVFHPVRDINTAKILYPGDEYVDWCGLSVFNHDICWPTWEQGGEFNNCDKAKEMDDNFKLTIEWMKHVARKPVIIAESAVQSHITEQTTSTHKTGYLEKLIHLIETYDIKAWVYINSDWEGHNWDAQWGDSRVETDPAVFTFWQNEVLKPRYIHYPETQGGTTDTGWVTSSEKNGLFVYPNPVEDECFVSGNISHELVLYALDGRVLKQISPDNDKINVSDLMPGIYILASGGQTLLIVKK
jgi:beta-mannanase